jgi:hypothetical protein
LTHRLAPPGGWPPPDRAELAGATVSLPALAAEVADRYFEVHPEDLERYGDVAREWELHDTQHLLNWAIGDVEGHVDLQEQVAWLAGILEARDFPLEHLASNLELAASVMGEKVEGGAPVGERLRAGAALIRERRTFLPPPPA